MIRFFLLFVQCVLLTACLRIEDVETTEEVTPTVVPKEAKDFIASYVVSGEVFVFQGQLLNRDSYLQAIRGKKISSQPVALRFRQLTFLPKATLYTMGADVKIEALKVQSQGGRISTFPLGMTAARGSKGRDGGFIYFHGVAVSGDLQFELRGEKGGPGYLGKEPDLLLKGADGHRIPGRCHESGSVIHGKKGKQGYPGGPGFSGGSTGNLEIFLQNETNFRYSVDRFPGEGGDGGRGGAGGEGGRTPTACGSSQKPERGSEGSPGYSGPRGNVGKVCITDGEATTCF